MNKPNDKQVKGQDNKGGFQSEDISALMDAEMAAETSVFLLRRITHDDYMSRKWQRYHLIRDVMLAEAISVSDNCFCESVRQGCVNAPVVAEQTAVSAGARQWYKPVLGLAMTAAVAFVAVTSVIQQPLNDQAVPGPAAVQSLANVSSSPDFVTPENPLITRASGMVTPVGSLASGAANSIYPQIPGQSETTTAEYLFQHNQLDGNIGQPVFVGPQVRRHGTIIVIRPATLKRK